MNLKFALSAFAAVAIAASAPTFAAAQTTSTGPDGRTVISSTPVPNPPERPRMSHHGKRHHATKHHRKHHVRKHHKHHSRHHQTTAKKADSDKK